MPYNEDLEMRIRVVMSGLPDLTAKKMFGGVGFLVKGNMACGVHKDALIVRVGPEGYEEALARPRDLRGWVQQGVDFALTLTPK
jgi:TfoX/Sxy family transcriptional regulator of competence genes